MKASFATGDLHKAKTDVIVLFTFENKKKADGQVAGLSTAAAKTVAAAVRRGHYTGAADQLLSVPTEGTGPNLLLAGLGKKKAFALDRLRRAAAHAAKAANGAHFGSLGCSVSGLDLPNDTTELTTALVEGATLVTYGFDKFKSKKQPFHLTKLEIRATSKKEATVGARALKTAEAICDSVVLVRDLGHTPGSTATPTLLAKTAKASAKKYGFQCKVLDRPQMEKLGMGGLLGVARGSKEPPKFIIMEHGRKTAGRKTVVVVGKGLTFDSGGISLKPGANMHEMKYDKMGGCTTIGIMQAVARLKLKLHVVGLVPASENMPSGTAQKPGDVVTAMNGKTIEVLNTDAEGRLILADALAYATRYKPDAVVDFATLTGAVIVCLGHVGAAVIGNDQPLIDKLLASGTATHERLWQLPLWDEYKGYMKGEVADLANIGSPGGGAGTITAGAFLSEFADKYKWAHLDIAGTGWGDGSIAPYTPKGPSGYGVRLLMHYLMQMA